MTISDSSQAVIVSGLGFKYGDRRALEGVDCIVERGEVHAFLGPNGSGKSTLFRVLSTILPVQEGKVEVLGLDLESNKVDVRSRIGVVFQSPALDRKLTVFENLKYAGNLHGLSGPTLVATVEGALERAGLGTRRDDRVEGLSGGLRRRVELVKGMLHEPQLLLLDEPSTGLDPAAREDLWSHLRGSENLTVLFTTHLLDEAAAADQVTILHEGRVVGAGTPADLLEELGDEVLEVRCSGASDLARDLEPALEEVRIQQVDGGIRLRGHDIHQLVPDLIQRFGDRIDKLILGHPGLDDVYMRQTGRVRSEQEQEV